MGEIFGVDRKKCNSEKYVISPYYWTQGDLYWNQDKEVNPILVPFYYEFVV